MKEMILGLLLALCPHLAVLKYVPYQGMMVIPGAYITNGRKYTTNEKSYLNCAKQCLYKRNCITFNYKGKSSGNCETVDHMATYNVKKNTKKDAAVGFLRDRATEAVLFNHVNTKGLQSHRGWLDDVSDCYSKCATFWSTQACIAIDLLNSNFSCYTVERFDALLYGDLFSTLIFPRIRPQNSFAVGGLEIIPYGYVKPQCLKRHRKYTADQCARACNKYSTCVSWRLSGSYGTCTYYKCRAYKQLRNNIGYTSGFQKGTRLDGMRLTDWMHSAPGMQLRAQYKEYKAKTETECEKKCKGKRKCQKYSFGSNRCRISGGSYMEIERARGYATNFISKPSSFFKRMEPCIFRGISFEGPALTSLNFKVTLTDCWDYCSQNVDCVTISLKSEPGYCTLRRSYTPTKSNKNSVVAIIRNARDGSCFLAGVQFTGKKSVSSKCISHGICKAECVYWAKRNGDCYGYTLKQKARECWVYGWNEHRVIKTPAENYRGRVYDWSGQIQF